jgi:tripartite-type tricarboxylate transporter receptor subunit TctC
MGRFRRSPAYLGLIGLAILAAAPMARADDYPSRPVTLVVPLGAGGAMDIIARASLGPKLAERLGRSVIIENRLGGGTVIAASAVAKSAPDGHTLLFAPSGTLTTNATLYKALPYDPGKDFTPVALTSKIGFVLVVNAALPIHTFADLVKYAKDNPGKLSYGSTGTGATPHLAVEMIKSATGIEMTHVPYKGSIAALNDVVAGHVHLTFTDPAISPQLIAAGKVRALGVSSLTRVGVMPDVPTLAEAGLPGFEAVSWHMLVVPAATPKEIVARLNAELKAIMALPEVQKQITDIGLIPMEPPPVDELQRFLHAEIVRWGKVVQQVGIAGTE